MLTPCPQDTVGVKRVEVFVVLNERGRVHPCTSATFREAG
jgi:hypothetical protein